MPSPPANVIEAAGLTATCCRCGHAITAVRRGEADTCLDCWNAQARRAAPGLLP